MPVASALSFPLPLRSLRSPSLSLSLQFLLSIFLSLSAAALAFPFSDVPAPTLPSARCSLKSTLCSRSMSKRSRAAHGRC
ncbi:hypothetical protein MRB53_027174 [Persea americana]|uniref:Uncharacterized protein n=1 Tax=Persea americana TaxID=3435 RepID=A0ACC2LL01_PERAE|nr:hypothetical protein MRB53_027174 [Persea americana]